MTRPKVHTDQQTREGIDMTTKRKPSRKPARVSVEAQVNANLDQVAAEMLALRAAPGAYTRPVSFGREK